MRDTLPSFSFSPMVQMLSKFLGFMNLTVITQSTSSHSSLSFSSFTLCMSVTGTRRRDHITLVLRELQWLPIRERINFRAACLVLQLLSGQAPVYLTDDCCLVPDSALCGQLRFRVVLYHEHTAAIVTELLQPLDLVGETLHRSSCAIQTSSTI